MTDRPVVVISEALDEGWAAWLGERADVRWARFDNDGFDQALVDAQGLIVRTYTKVTADLLDTAPGLRVVGRAGVGLDNIDQDACQQHGVRVVYTPDANTQAVVEYVLGLMLDHVRPRTDLPSGADAQAFHRMRQTEVGRDLGQMTLGVVGFGRIGRRVARTASSLGMTVLACDLLDEFQIGRDIVSSEVTPGSVRLTSHDEVYRASDIVTLHADGRARNRHMVGAAELALFKRDALLINAARGMLLDPAALGDWLRDRPGATAVLDVHDPEPPVANDPQDPLAGLANLRRLPHLASRTETALGNMSAVAEDVWRVLQGHAPHWPAWRDARDEPVDDADPADPADPADGEDGRAPDPDASPKA
ncbi:MAG: NAD(P)-dependent oxidoreductase [Planctomycetota bacterium]